MNARERAEALLAAIEHHMNMGGYLSAIERALRSTHITQHAPSLPPAARCSTRSRWNEPRS